jgi:hypothetical protein
VPEEALEKRAGRAARKYRDIGLSPLPSAHHDKKPALPEYAKFRKEPLPDEFFLDWPTRNVQLLLGACAYGSQKILVVDCDGERAKEVWAEMRKANGEPERGWVVRTGGGGEHWHFRVPDGVESVETGVVWGQWDTWGRDGKGGWVKHREVRVLGDGALAVVPPSAHVETGVKYEFSTGPNPVTMPELPEAPDWLLGMPRLRGGLSAQRAGVESRRSANDQDRQTVLDGIEDKARLAASWGLRFNCCGPNSAGWMSCHSFSREDRNASASFHAGSGVYKDMRDGTKLSLFDLGIALGAFGDFAECIQWCRSHHASPYRQAISLLGGDNP